MANIVAEIQPVEFNFGVDAPLFEGDDFLWERFLKEQDIKTGEEVDIPLAGYAAVFEVVDENAVLIFSVNSTDPGYPTDDGIVLGTTDGQVTVYKRNLPASGDYTYTLRMSVNDTNGTTVTMCYGQFVITEN